MKTLRPPTANQHRPGLEAGSHFQAAAFTLVELLTVLVLSGLVAVSVALSVRPSLATAKQASAVQRCCALDRTLREQCVKNGISKDLLVTGLRRFEVRDQASGESRVLESDIPLRRVLTPFSESTGELIGLQFRPDGSSPTYCLEIGPSALASRFLVFVGGSGQVLELPDEAGVQDIFDAVRSASR